MVSDLVEFGTVQRAYMGVSIQEIDAKFCRRQKHIKQLKGVYVNGITSYGSAEEAGLRKDVITGISQRANIFPSELQEQLSLGAKGQNWCNNHPNERDMTIPAELKSLW